MERKPWRTDKIENCEVEKGRMKTDNEKEY